MTRAKSAVPIERIDVSSYRVPTDSHESDATLALVTAHAGGHTGIGYTYGGPSVATVVSGKLGGVVTGNDALRPATSWAEMQHAVRNLGKPGVVAMAISAVDIALWDLHARLLELPLVTVI